MANRVKSKLSSKRQKLRTVPRKTSTFVLRETPVLYRTAPQELFSDVEKANGKKYGYNPVYTDKPFTDFASIDSETDLSTLNLNWHEKDLPEAERTKHVHRLHPYLGKYIPQLVEIFLRKFKPKVVYDPFAGSGTTLVEAKSLGIASVGCDVSAFNCLLSERG
jgi:DNA modification methylase